MAAWSDCNAASMPESYDTGRTLKTISDRWFLQPRSPLARSEDVVSFSPHSGVTLDRQSTNGGSSNPGGSRGPGSRGR